MSYYVYGSGISYSDYLQQKSFVSDIESGLASINLEISDQTREIVSSIEHIEQTVGHIRETIGRGIDTLTMEVRGIRGVIDELNATFHWGFSELIAGVGHLNDSLAELISIAKTPAQTWAYNQYEISRDAFRRNLFIEALESVERAINGYGDNTGYKLDYRFHFHKGILLLGDIHNNDPSFINLPKAREAFLLAARYAASDWPKEAARAYLSASWASYCLGDMKNALIYSLKATDINKELAEALFLSAKICIHNNSVRDALAYLRNAIGLDRLYALKAGGDDDFKKHESELQSFLLDLRDSARSVAELKGNNAQKALNMMSKWEAQGGSEIEAGNALTKNAQFNKLFINNSFFDYQDAAELADQVVIHAEEACQAQFNKSTDRLRSKILGIKTIRTQIVTTAPGRLPKELAIADVELENVSEMITPARSWAESDWETERKKYLELDRIYRLFENANEVVERQLNKKDIRIRRGGFATSLFGLILGGAIGGFIAGVAGVILAYIPGIVVQLIVAAAWGESARKNVYEVWIWLCFAAGAVIGAIMGVNGLSKMYRSIFKKD